MPGGLGNRHKDRTFYEGLQYPERRRPCPDDFRETYIEMGWEGITEHYRTNWRVICRWIDESGGQELCDARRAYLHERGFHTFNSARHVGGWTAAKLEALHRG